MASFTVATPQGGDYYENVAVDLVAYTDDTQTTEDTTARVYWQRYVQSDEGVYNITQRSNIAGSESGCINVRFFDPDRIPTPLYSAPSECSVISEPLEATDSSLQAAYVRGDFSIQLNGYDAVTELGFTIRSMFKDNGDPIDFEDFKPGNIYVNPEIGAFMFFHHPDQWDACSYWDFAWWDHGGLSASELSKPPYVTNWGTGYRSVVSITRSGSTATVTVPSHGWTSGDVVSIRGADQPEYNEIYVTISVLDGNTFTYEVSGTPTTPATTSTEITAGKAIAIPENTVVDWDGKIGEGWAEARWGDLADPLPINTYWDTVSEAPGENAFVVVCYWTKDDTDPLEPRSELVTRDSVSPSADEMWHYQSHLFTSPITISTDTQLRFRSVNDLNEDEVEDTKTETYTVGARIELDRGVNLVSQPNVPAATDLPNVFDLEQALDGLDVIQVFRNENGRWEAFRPRGTAVAAPVNDFELVDNQHGLYIIMSGPGTWCFPYGEAPTTTELTLVDKNTNEGLNAIAIPRASVLQDNSIDNLLTSRGVEFDEIHRVTNGVFETYITDRPDVLNFDPAELMPGRGYGVITSSSQTFELPFVD